MPTETLVKSLSPQEYLSQEELAIERHEYIKGKLNPMRGGTPRHNTISGNLFINLKLALKKQSYGVFLTDLRLWIPDPEVYTYPDVMVTGKPLVMQAGRKDTVMNVYLIAEVLSPSTKNYDRSEKFDYYRAIPEFQDYLLIEQDRVWVEHYTRLNEKQWNLTQYRELDEVIRLESVGCDVALADIYDDVEIDSLG
jgi:Uma2 family endonuclease